MAKQVREIIRIDESKCNGCGRCVPSCREGALKIVDGKARLVAEAHCDGLGSCLGTCPQGAITIERREVEAFEGPAPQEAEVKVKVEAEAEVEAEVKVEAEAGAKLPCGCPGSMARSFAARPQAAAAGFAAQPSALTTWPIKLALVSPKAPWLAGSHLLLLADCAAAASPALHAQFIAGRVPVLACPKLDNASAHVQRLAELIRVGRPASIEVLIMEVPCCQGLLEIARQAKALAGSDIPIQASVVRIEDGSSQPIPTLDTATEKA